MPIWSAPSRLPRAAAAMLVLAGFEMPERSEVPELIAELGLQARVRILGYLPLPQLTAIFQGASVFAYPTSAEGWACRSCRLSCKGCRW